jgi:hypothetical protein
MALPECREAMTSSLNIGICSICRTGSHPPSNIPMDFQSAYTLAVLARRDRHRIKFHGELWQRHCPLYNGRTATPQHFALQSCSKSGEKQIAAGQTTISTAKPRSPWWAAGKSHRLHGLVEILAKCQVLQAAGQSHLLHGLVEKPTTCKILQAAGQSHLLLGLFEMVTKN